MKVLSNSKLPMSPLAIVIGCIIGSHTLAQENNNLEEMVVTGIKASVTKALDLKRAEVGVSDAISADDIGSLPDENIAESIQRIPGVQIERDEGRGSLISLRGLGPAYASTTLNGQAFASANFSGGFRYDIVQSEIASDIQVFKTPSASLEEGGLTGTVNIGTAKPLNFNERKIMLKAEAMHTTNRDSTTPGLGISYIDQFHDGKLGVLLNAGYQELNSRYDLMFNHFFADVNVDGQPGPDFSSDGLTPVERTDRPRFRREDTDTRRHLLNGTIQYIANDDLELTFTGVYANDDRDKYLQQLVPLLSGGSPAPIIHLLGSSANTWDQIGAENIRIEGNHTREMENRTSYALTTTADWDATEKLNVKGTVHYTKGNTDYDSHQLLVQMRSHLYVDMNPNNPTFISGSIPGVAGLEDANFHPVNDPASWDKTNLTSSRISGESFYNTNDETAFQLDTEYSLDSSFLKAVKVGAKYRQQSLGKSRSRFSLPASRIVNNLSTGLPEVSDGYIVVDDFTGGKFPGMDIGFVLPDLKLFMDSLYIDPVGNGNPSDFVYGTPQEILPETIIPAEFFEIDRDIASAYTQLDFGSDKFRGNIGVRYTTTDREVRSYNTGANIPGLVANETIDTTGFEYDNWLPSFNLAYDLTDDIVLRASTAKTMIRPGIAGGTSAFGRSVTVNQENGNIVVREGSATLPALTADQYDLSAEWYFADASALSVAYFAKDIKNQTRNELVCPSDFALANVSFNSTTQECTDNSGQVFEIYRQRVTNGVLKIQGVEFGYNQSFDFLPAPFNGLGMIANLTLLDAKNPAERQPLLGSSEETYNLIGFYEQDGFSMRIALNHRSDYSLNDGFFAGANSGASSALVPNPGQKLDARNQIDFSIGYDINENLKVSFEGLNINGDYELATRFEEERLQSIATFGPTYFLRLRYSM